MIQTIDDLAKFFVINPELFNTKRQPCVFVSEELRMEWMLRNLTITKNGTVRDIEFTDFRGGVWEAKLRRI